MEDCETKCEKSIKYEVVVAGSTYTCVKVEKGIS